MSRPELSVESDARRQAMDRSGSRTARAAVCPNCRAELDAHENVSSKESTGHCIRCGGRLPSGDGQRGTDRTMASVSSRSPPLGGLVLVWRNWVLRLLERIYWIGTFIGSLTLLVCGGFVPVARGWLRNEIDGWSDIVGALGGIWFRD
jgi:hypothetical protein